MPIPSMEKNSIEFIIEDSIANNIEDAFGTTFIVVSTPISPFNINNHYMFLLIYIKSFYPFECQSD